MSKKPWRAGKDLSAVVENMEIGTGQRGDGRHAFVTREELVGLKLAKRRGVNSSGYVLNPGIDQDWGMPAPEYPTKPQNFLATGGFGSVLLEWDMAQYRGHSLTEIWRGTEDDLADAVLVATTPGQVYGDPVDPGWSGFYWIRFVNSAGVKGPWNGVRGTPAETQISVKAVIDQIREEAAKSPIVSELRKEIKNAQGEAVKAAAIQTTEVVGNLREETTRTIGGVETRIHTLDESTSQSLNEVNGRIKKLDEEGGKAFLAMWSKKAGVEGITAGIGIVAGKDGSGNPVSQVAISASQLFVFDPNDPNKKAYPFAVSGGKVVIPKLMVEDAVIETMISRRVVADEVKAGVSISTPTLRSATIQNGNFQVDSAGNMNARNANLSNVTARGGVFYDIRAVNSSAENLNVNRGTLNNVHIRENCQIDGTLRANQIIGDIAKTYVLGPAVTIPPQMHDMVLVCLSYGGYGLDISGAPWRHWFGQDGFGRGKSLGEVITSKKNVHTGGSSGHSNGANITVYEYTSIKLHTYLLEAGHSATISSKSFMIVWMSKA